MPVDKLLSPLFRIIIAFAKELDAVPDMTVRPNDVNSVAVHSRIPHQTRRWLLTKWSVEPQSQ